MVEIWLLSSLRSQSWCVMSGHIEKQWPHVGDPLGQSYAWSLKWKQTLKESIIVKNEELFCGELKKIGMYKKEG